jgi:hypothetical protein
MALAGGESARDLMAVLPAEIADHRRRIETRAPARPQTPRNSSQPPSSEPPSSRAERRRAAREVYRRSMRQSGGHPCHEGKSREMAPPERGDRSFARSPERCDCGYVFGASEQRLADPLINRSGGYRRSVR